MKYGIPFTRPFTSPFGAPFFGLGGGGIPSEPTGFVAKYTSYLVDNFTLVTGDSVNVWADETTKTYGSEEVTNGDFSGGDTDWNYDPTYTNISGGKCSWNGIASANLSQTAVVDIGTKYIITFDVSDMTTGLLLFRNPSSTTSLSVSANGSYSQMYSALDNDVTFRGSSGFDGSIDNISVKEVLTGANDLTQATSANQPKLVEDFTATQYTASNQPTLVDDAGTWKLEFDSNDFMNGLKPQSGDFTYVFTGLDIPTYTTSTDVLISNGDATNLERILNIQGSIRINDRANNIVFLEPWNNEDTIVVRLSGNTLSVFAGGLQIGSDTDVTGSVFDNIYRIGRVTSNSFNGTLQSLETYDVAVADVNNITETPVQSLMEDPLKMRTSANANPTDGQDVAKWYADEFSAYRDSRVVFDATNDNMSGLPALTGDWSYMIDTSINTLGTTKYLLEQTAGSSAILALADNYMYLRDTTGANDIALTSYTLTTGRTQFGFVRSGDDLLYYVNGVLKETVDVTGRIFDFGTVGKNATSADMDTKQIIPFDRALTQTEIDYYSYLRSETGDILLPPLLPS